MNLGHDELSIWPLGNLQLVQQLVRESRNSGVVHEKKSASRATELPFPTINDL